MGCEKSLAIKRFTEERKEWRTALNELNEVYNNG